MGVPKGFGLKLTQVHLEAILGPIKVVGGFLVVLEHLFAVVKVLLHPCNEIFFKNPTKKASGLFFILF